MIKTLNLTNETIYNYAINIAENFKEDISLPVKINFYLQKNLKKILELGREIEQTRMEICEKYGKLDEESGNYSFDEESSKKASNEVIDLLKLTQEVKINMIDLSVFTDDIVLTSKQISAIEFMINDEEE